MAEHITRIALQRSFMLTLVVVAVLGSGCATSYMRSEEPTRYRPCSRDDASAFYPATMLNFATETLQTEYAWREPGTGTP